MNETGIFFPFVLYSRAQRSGQLISGLRIGNWQCPGFDILIAAQSGSPDRADRLSLLRESALQLRKCGVTNNGGTARQC